LQHGVNPHTVLVVVVLGVVPKHGPHVAKLQVYQALVVKHKSVCVEYRKLMEERGDAVASAADELLEARQQMADLAVKYDAAQDTVAELR
jgi:hypothetical protein